MLKENLKDAGEIIQNILTQPLSIAGTAEDISLLKAAMNYQEGQGEASDLAKIVKSFLAYREPTETMLRELEIILKEISVSA